MPCQINNLCSAATAAAQQASLGNLPGICLLGIRLCPGAETQFRFGDDHTKRSVFFSWIFRTIWAWVPVTPLLKLLCERCDSLQSISLEKSVPLESSSQPSWRGHGRHLRNIHEITGAKPSSQETQMTFCLSSIVQLLDAVQKRQKQGYISTVRNAGIVLPQRLFTFVPFRRSQVPSLVSPAKRFSGGQHSERSVA